MEAHVRQKLQKIVDMVGEQFKGEPFWVEVFLKANFQHQHHRVEINLKTPRFDLNAHYENPDMYWAIDHTIDRIVEQLVKHKGIAQDKKQKRETEKTAFEEDKYTLGED
jgi:ribosomal subunit interface protein